MTPRRSTHFTLQSVTYRVQKGTSGTGPSHDDDDDDDGDLPLAHSARDRLSQLVDDENFVPNTLPIPLASSTPLEEYIPSY